MCENKVELWRRQRAKRRAKTLAAELRRKPIEIRPGGNEYQPDHAKYAGMEPPREAPAGPVVKHVTQNTHRIGSIAWSFFYRYIVPGA